MYSSHRQLLAAVLPVTIIGAVVIMVSVGILRRELLTAVETEARSRVQVARTDVEGYFDTYISVGRTIASTPLVRSRDREAIVEHFRREEERLGEPVVGLYWNEPDGTVTSTDGVIFSVADRSYFPRIVRGEEVVSGVLVSRSTGRRVIVLLFPVFDQGERIGAVGITLSVEELIDEITRTTLPRSGEAILLSNDGELLSRSPLAETLQGYIVRMTPHRLSLEGPLWPEPLELFMEDVLPTHWHVLHVYRRDALLAPVQAASQTLILTLIAGIILVSGVSFLYTRSSIKPIKALAAAMDRYGQGSQHTRAPVFGPEESRSLATTFNTMADTLARREKERNEALTTLAERTELLRGIIDNNLSVIFIKDLQGRYVQANLAFTRVHGLALEEILGKTDRQLFDNPSADLLPEHDRQIIQTGSAMTFEEEVGIGGDLRSYLTVKFPIRAADGSTIGVGGIATEITERKRIEAQLLQAQRMESVGRLAGGVAHDFNNLLTAILGYCDLAREQARLGESTQDSIASIKEAGERAVSLTRQLLAFGRRSFGEPFISPVEDLIAESHHLISRILGDTISLQLRVAPDTGAIFIDPGQFQQVLLNLTTNAKDAMPRGGSLIITASRAPADQVQAGTDTVQITFHDSGEGIPKDDLDRIFEPFFSTKDLGRGVGLGLASTHGIIKQASGRIEAICPESGGTMIVITLPRHDPDTRAHTPPRVDLKGHAIARTILYVDDEPIVRSITENALRGLGYTVLAADSGQNALNTYLAHRTSISLIITDVVMPSMSGPELIERLRAFGPLPPVLFTTGYADASALAGISLDGAVVSKPYTMAELASRIRRALDESTIATSDKPV